MGRLSATSVLAGALCGLAAFEALAVMAGAVAVAINGSTNFATMSSFSFKATTGLIAVVAMLCSFLFGGYVGGRMARRAGRPTACCPEFSEWRWPWPPSP